MPIWGYGCGMVDCSVCAGIGDDAGDQRYHRELAANRSGASKTCRPGASECSIDLRRPLAFRAPRGSVVPGGHHCAPFDERFGQWENSFMAAVVEA